MIHPFCTRASRTGLGFGGYLGDYVAGIVDQWLLVAPKANPGMLEMFRDRDASPLRQMVPWAGEFAGKYLTAAVQILRITGDPKLKAWLKEFVRILADLQDEDGYLGPWPEKCHITNVNSVGEKTWDTWGHYHVMMGLLLWHEETGGKAALSCATRIADLLCARYLGRKRPRLVDTGSTEMNLAPAHALCVLYRKTLDDRYLDLALQIVDEFAAEEDGAPLAGDYLRQARNGTEFYQTPKPRWESLHPIMALAELYWITGDGHYREAFEHIWWSIAEYDRHNNGGFSSGEQATGNPYHLAPIESCCTIAWTALSVEMLKLTGNSIVADELELTLLNSIVGMFSSTGRWATYDTPMNGVRRASAHSIVFQSREGTPELNCCSVNAPRGFGMLSDWALMKDNEGLILNYYGPSTLKAKVKGGRTIELRQETEYPASGLITITIDTAAPAPCVLKLRIPHWSRTTRVRVNGSHVQGAQSGRYLRLEREWKAGDRIEIHLDMRLHMWKGKRECSGSSSLYRGPILLAYDHRYNLEHAGKGNPLVRDTEEWDPAACMLTVPGIDANHLAAKPVRWSGWMPPALLFEITAGNGKTARLCDFGSAGEAGTPYRSWLPVKNGGKAVAFTRQNPLRSRTVGS